MAPPALDDNPHRSERADDLCVEPVIPRAVVERLDEAVLPGRTRFDA